MTQPKTPVAPSRCRIPKSSLLAPGRHVHVVGVGGIGMSALAQLLHWQGVRVSGSDRECDAGRSAESRVLSSLAQTGVSLRAQDGAGVRPETACVVISSAIEADNPDRQAADALGVPVLHRSEVLALALSAYRGAAVTGTSGKTTVTAMLGAIMTAAGWDPLVVNGGIMNDAMGPATVGNVRPGAGEWCVFEADESDRSLMAYTPDAAIITNATTDHFSEDEVRALFGTFSECVKGPIVAGLSGLASVAVDAGRRFSCGGVELLVPMRGEHNVENAHYAVMLARELGVPEAAIKEGLESFAGVHRRLERVGHARGIEVIDDYAHNPAKIAAAIRAVQREGFRVLAVWQAHGYGPLRTMFDELIREIGEALRPDDILALRPVYDAGGTADRSISSADLVRAMHRADGPRVVAVEAAPGALRFELESLSAGDLVLSLGARDPALAQYARDLAGMLVSDASSP